MKKYQSFNQNNFRFLEVKFSIYFNRRVFVIVCCVKSKKDHTLRYQKKKKKKKKKGCLDN